MLARVYLVHDRRNKLISFVCPNCFAVLPFSQICESVATYAQIIIIIFLMQKRIFITTQLILQDDSNLDASADWSKHICFSFSVDTSQVQFREDEKWRLNSSFLRRLWPMRSKKTLRVISVVFDYIWMCRCPGMLVYCCMICNKTVWVGNKGKVRVLLCCGILDPLKWL